MIGPRRRDSYGRPLPPSSWCGVGMPAPGFYHLRFVKNGPWVPAVVAVEQTCDPEGRLCDRWAETLRILRWDWHRWELMAWQSALHPISREEFQLAVALGLPCSPFEAKNKRR